MEINILRESGYLISLYGIGLSYGITSDISYEDFQTRSVRIEKCRNVAIRLMSKDGGHNKFLEHIQVWLDINAPRYWWQEFDTYRVGTSKQSESTMHTITKKYLTEENFENHIPEDILKHLNKNIEEKEFVKLKGILPESFLQKRIVNTNYKVLRNMILQRKTHKLKQWHLFIDQIYKQSLHPEFLPKI